MRASLRVPVKRSGALVATNPARNSRPELIADDERSVILPARSSARDRDCWREAAGSGSGWFWQPHRTDRFRHALKNAYRAPGMVL